MGKWLRQLFINAGLIGAAVSLCVQEFLTEYLEKRWQEMSWGWLAIALTLYWVGLQVGLWVAGQHDLQAWWSARKKFVAAPSARKQTTPSGYAYYADLKFTRHVKNIVILVETFRAEIQFLPPLAPRAWVRCNAFTPLKRADCNKGSTENIKLIELQYLSGNAAPVNALSGLAGLAASQNALAPTPPKRETSADIKVKVTVTAADQDAQIFEFPFWWKGAELYILPRETPEIGTGGDSKDFKEEGAILWTTEK